jgi:hypothetical protein
MIPPIVRKQLSIAIALAVCIALIVAGKGQAVISRARFARIAPSFSNIYSLVNLGSVQRLPPAYGGLTFMPNNSNILLIGGSADTPESAIYSVRVKRNKDKHITGFLGVASFFSKAPGIGKGGIDAGLTSSPKGDVLFYTTLELLELQSIQSLGTFSSPPFLRTTPQKVKYLQ